MHGERFFDKSNNVFTLARAVEPLKIRLFTEPDQLASRVSTVLLDDERARFSFAAHAAEHLHYLSIDEAAERSCFGWHAASQQRTNFADDATGELLVDPSRDPFGRERRRQTQGDGDDLAISDRRHRLCEVGSQRTTGRVKHLQRPDEPLAIARHDARVKNVWFDATAVVRPEMAPAELRQIAARIREIGVEHVLYGSDAAASPLTYPKAGWAAFRRLPLTEAEFGVVANNIAPYMRD